MLFNRNKLFNMMLKALLTFSILIIFISGITTIPAKAKDKENARTVRVGYYIAPGFQEYDEKTGEYSGLSYEYLMALKLYTGWDYEFVPVEFSDGVKMLQDGKLDLMNNVSKTPEREEKLGFSMYASGSNYACLVVRSDDTNYAYNDYETFSNMTIGLLNNSIYNSYFSEYCDRYHISPTLKYYDNGVEANEALEKGDIDARIISNSYNIDVRVVGKFAPMDYYFAVPIAEQDLLKELNDALTKVRTDLPNLDRELNEKYETAYEEKAVVLSGDEKKYLETHPVVKVATSKMWYPISYFDENGNYKGTLAKIYDEISKATGLTFDFVPCDDYIEALDTIKAKEIDMISECPYNFNFANQYGVMLSDVVGQVSVYRVMANRKHAEDIKKVALFNNVYLNKQVKKYYGNKVTYVSYENMQDAVNAVLKGEVDCTHLNFYQSVAFQNQGKYIELNYYIMPSLQYDFAIGISDTADPALQSLVAKGLNHIGKEEISELFENTAGEEDEMDLQAVFYRNPTFVIVVISGICVLVALLITFLIYRNRMREKNQELVRANNAKTDFLSNMSHEIRTPMNAIIGMTKLAQEEHSENAKVKAYLKEIDESSKYLLNILNDVLDMSRIESGHFTLHKEWVSPRDVTVPCLDMIIPLMKEKNISFIYDEHIREATFYEYYVDIMKTQQLVINLLNNAYKYTPENGTVTLKFKNIYFDKARMITIDSFVIEDNGCGMSKEFQKKIFTPFEQERNQYTGPVAGTGLGLALSKSIANQMGGDITVESELGKGSKFTATFTSQYRMKTKKLSENTEPHKEEMKYDLEGKKVLMAEDHPINAKIARTIMENRGMIVQCAENGEIACDIFAESDLNEYDAILMDIRMPVMDGLEATKKIRNMNRADARQIPIIAVSANAFDNDIEKSKEAGMNEHLAKPINPDILYNCLQKFFDKNVK